MTETPQPPVEPELTEEDLAGREMESLEDHCKNAKEADDE